MIFSHTKVQILTAPLNQRSSDGIRMWRNLKSFLSPVPPAARLGSLPDGGRASLLHRITSSLIFTISDKEERFNPDPSKAAESSIFFADQGRLPYLPSATYMPLIALFPSLRADNNEHPRSYHGRALPSSHSHTRDILPFRRLPQIYYKMTFCFRG